ncbi:sulfatase-like hydrolase/transferase [Tomitella biformata]|uniref:sulfatase-like hydrolase/transferase n=1 Tax=Tomitella biformata TaxID=630403 RepID=UPI000464B557|nr:sulfatase-like hydrolase/transferase [Tomitella biformata]
MGATALAAGVASTLGARQSRAAPGSGGTGALPARPNIVVIITDQERQPQHWPPGWSEENLPNRKRLSDTGVSFTQAFCASAMCSPSRSSLFTGLYPSQHGVTATLTTGGTVSPSEPQLQASEQNMAKMLASAGYNVHYRGKWHMSKGATGADPSTEDLASFGFHGWVPPEAGQDTEPANFGGGCADRDRDTARQAVDFISQAGPASTGGDAPFALIVSFVNPHDALAYPRTWDQEDGDCDNYGSAPGAFTQGIGLPPTYGEMLATNHKPSAHVQLKALLAGGLGPLPGAGEATNYVNFYAYLQKVVDEHIGSVVDALDAVRGLREQTVVFRISDHGEMGMSHGGLRQKAFNAYEETLNVPLVISNPAMFPAPASTNALASLVDLMPTMATMAGVPDRGAWWLPGADLTPAMAAAARGDAGAAVQDAVLFTYDDQNAAAPDGQNVVRQPNHIRCIRDTRWKYSVYFAPDGSAFPQFELYDLQKDPLELNNKADPTNFDGFDLGKSLEMHQRLLALLDQRSAVPPGFGSMAGLSSVGG